MDDHTLAADGPAPTPPTTPRGALDVVLAGLAVLLHLAAAWLVLVSGLLAPGWALLVGWALWAATTVLLVRALRGRSRLAPLLPLGLVAVWVGVLSLGDVVLGWTA